ncbi:MAG: isochorismatase family protein [Chloroflexi bacterium]|jgi:nicotinamidase/pyrazinamidase|nr:isochorismatase family protein [Chloroflexota bacterium]
MHEEYAAGTALLVVDVQNDFADPAGGLFVGGAEAILPLLNEEIAAARAAGAVIAYTQDWHPASTPHFAKDGGTWPVHCVGGTWGAQIHPGLIADAGPSIRKGSNGEDGYSGFTMRDHRTGATVPTELDGLLRSHGVRRVVIGGLATDYCVRATALDALALGYATHVLVDGVRPVEIAAGDGERALAEMERAGAVLVHRSAAAAVVEGRA